VQSKDKEIPFNSQLQQRLDTMVTELVEMKQQVENFKQRAEKAEGETVEVRKSLAEMIATLRRERLAAQAKGTRSKDGLSVADLHDLATSEETSLTDSAVHHGLDPADMKELENAVTALTQQRRHHLLENSTPYASILGVVLLGVGIMAYLNGWQKIER
jgi:maltooligosyltrehalose synthase